jgi:hypothetical protein
VLEPLVKVPPFEVGRVTTNVSPVLILVVNEVTDTVKVALVAATVVGDVVIYREKPIGDESG